MSQSEEDINFLNYWQEVSKQINSLIKLTWPITRGRIQKLNFKNTTEDQLFHIIEECVEYQQELLKLKYSKADYEALDNENLDILFAWLAMQHIINQNGGIDKFAFAGSLKKFEKREWIKLND